MREYCIKDIEGRQASDMITGSRLSEAFGGGQADRYRIVAEGPSQRALKRDKNGYMIIRFLSDEIRKSKKSVLLLGPRQVGSARIAQARLDH